MKKTYIVIGASAAGIGALTKLRTLDKDATVICVTAEKEMPYNRCLLADHLAGIKTVEDVATKSSDFFTSNNITLMLDAKVVKIIPQEHKVLLESGQELSYDKLFIGAGRSSWMPTIPGSELTGVFSFYDLKDVKNILAFITTKKPKNVVVVGAGLSGVECADALTHHGVAVTIVERAAHILPHQLDADGAQLLTGLMQQKNVAVQANTSVQEIRGNGQVHDIILANGQTIPCEMVIFAIGGATNAWLAREAGLETNGNGISVNDFMQTSDPNIFAGGDICLVKDILTNNRVQSCLWPDAVMQGMVAAQGMVGQPKAYAGSLIVTSSHIFDTTFVTCGPVINPSPDYRVIMRRDTNFYHKFLVHDKKLKGFVMVGNVDNVGSLRKQLLTQAEFEINHQ